MLTLLAATIAACGRATSVPVVAPSSASVVVHPATADATPRDTCLDESIAGGLRLSVQRRHRLGIEVLRTGPDYFVTWSSDASVGVWSNDGGRLLRMIDLPSWTVNGLEVDFGRHAAWVHGEGLLARVNLLTGEVKRVRSLGASAVLGLDFLPDGQPVVSGYFDDHTWSGFAWLDPEGHRHERRLPVGATPSPFRVTGQDSVLLVSGASVRSVALSTGETTELGTLPEPVRSVARAARARFLMHSPSGRAFVFDVARRATVAQFQGRAGVEGCLLPDGSYVWPAGGYGEAVAVHAVAARGMTTDVTVPAAIDRVACVPDAPITVLAQYADVRLVDWGTRTSSLVSVAPPEMSDLVVSADGSRMMVVARAEGTLGFVQIPVARLFDLATGRSLFTLMGTSASSAAQLDDRHWIIHDGAAQGLSTDQESSVPRFRILDTSDGSERTIPDLAAPWEPYGPITVASGSIVTGAVRRGPRGGPLEEGDASVTFLPLDGGSGNAVEVALPSVAVSMATSSDGRSVALGTRNGEVVLVDVPERRIRNVWRAHPGWRVNGVAFSPDGRELAAIGSDTERGFVLRPEPVPGDCSVAYFELSTGTERRRIPDVSCRATGLVYQGDETVSVDEHGEIVRVAADGTIRRHTMDLDSNAVRMALAGRRLLVMETLGSVHVLEDDEDRLRLALVAHATLDRSTFGTVTVAADGAFDFDDRAALENVHFVDGMRVFRFEQLFDTLYEPGVGVRVLGRRRPSRYVRSDLRLLPPRVEADARRLSGATAEITVRVSDEGGGVESVRLLRGGRIVAVGDGAPVQRFQIPLVSGPNEITAFARSTDGLRSFSRVLSLGEGPPPELATTLHVLAIGIDDYGGPRQGDRRGLALAPVAAVAGGPPAGRVQVPPNLEYAIADAEAIASSLAEHGAPLFDRVETRVLRDASRDGILAALEELARNARPSDVVVVFLAGHGVALHTGDSCDATQEYVFVPHDYGAVRDLERTGLLGSTLFERLSRVEAGTIHLWLDTCQAGAGGDALAVNAIGAVGMLGGRTGVHVFAGASTYEQAAESARTGHGAFTAALLEAMACRGGEIVSGPDLARRTASLLGTAEARQTAQFSLADDDSGLIVCTPAAP